MSWNLQPRLKSDSSTRVNEIGRLVIGLSVILTGIMLLAIPNLGNQGEIGRFAHGILGPLLLCMAAWGPATGIGLLRAWRWARISMLVFSSLLALCGTLSVVLFLFMPSGGVSGWTLFVMKAFTLSLNLIPIAIGVRWFIFFTRKDVKGHFQTPRGVPIAPVPTGQ